MGCCPRLREVTPVQVDYAQKTYCDEYYPGPRRAELRPGLGRSLGRPVPPLAPGGRGQGRPQSAYSGCGTGNDAARLAREGFHVVATDLSIEAAAREKYGDLVDVRVVDMAAGLPFPEAGFDAVMANVALHMFSDAVTRAVFAGVRRVLRRGRAGPARTEARLRAGEGRPDGPLLLADLSG
jgi:SAM-dependent methyltransferase